MAHSARLFTRILINTPDGLRPKGDHEKCKTPKACSVFHHIVAASPVDAICSRERLYMIRCGVAFQIRYKVIVTSYRDRAGWRAEGLHSQLRLQMSLRFYIVQRNSNTLITLINYR